MSGRKLVWEITYWVIFGIVVWAIYRDGPPVRLSFWHYTYRASYAVARTAGKLGLAAERNYHDGMTQVRGS